MDSYVEDLMRKLKILNETVWEDRATQNSITEWLSNFSADLPNEPGERFHALFLLSQFMYFGSHEVRELLQAMHRDLYKYPIVQSARRQNANTVDASFLDGKYEYELLRTKFLGMGNPSESGCHLLYYYRQENRLPKELFVHTHEVFRRYGSQGVAELRFPDVSHYVFIDDFCGSGTQAVTYSEEVLADLKHANPDATVDYHLLFATEEGCNNIIANSLFDEVRAIHVLDSSYKCFGQLSRYFLAASSMVDRQRTEAMCRKYGSDLFTNDDALGFENGQLLLGFHHNTPDNTLPIFWYDEEDKPWVPIFRRYPKMEFTP